MDDPAEAYRSLFDEAPGLFSDRAPGGYRILEPDGRSSIVAYEDAFVVLLRDRVIAPSGATGNYIRLLTKPVSGRGVVILPLLGDKVVILRQYRHATGQLHVELPRGFGEGGEDSCSSALRELAEETGLVPEELVPLGSMHPDSGILASTVDLFLARCPSGQAVVTEHGVGFELISPAELQDRISSDEITDSFTHSAFLRARLKGLV